MQGGELLDQMVDSHAFSEREAAEIMYTVVKTVNFLHQEGVGMGGARRRAGESRRKGGPVPPAPSTPWTSWGGGLGGSWVLVMYVNGVLGLWVS